MLLSYDSIDLCMIDLTRSGPPSPIVYPQLGSLPWGTSSTTNQDQGSNVRDRKRTYSTHLDVGNAQISGNKSRRTTPTHEGSSPDNPFDDENSDSSSLVDLTGVEGAQPLWMKLQREEEEKIRQRKQMEEEDVFFAQQLQDDFNRAESPPAASAFQNTPSAPNAFQHIQDRASGLSQANNGLPRSASPGGHQQMTTSIPTHVRAGPFSSPVTARDQSQNWFGSSPAASGSRMPGAYDPYSDDLFGPEPFEGDAVYGSGRNADSPAAGSDLEVTRVVPTNYGIQTLTNGSRPGTLVNGHSGASLAGNSLGDIINRANNFDFTTGLDGNGNALPEESLNFIRSLEIDQDHYGNGRVVTSDDIRNLLANIPTDAQPDNQAETPEGFHHPLYLHQKIALKWMQGMEADERKRGGILADDMGLGKTITTLALVLTRPPEPLPGSRYPNVSLLSACLHKFSLTVFSSRLSLSLLYR